MDQVNTSSRVPAQTIAALIEDSFKAIGLPMPSNAPS
jgi:hypothetical protein